MVSRRLPKLYIFLIIILTQVTFYVIYFVTEIQYSKKIERNKHLIDSIKRILDLSENKSSSSKLKSKWSPNETLNLSLRLEQKHVLDSDQIPRQMVSDSVRNQRVTENKSPREKMESRNDRAWNSTEMEVHRSKEIIIGENRSKICNETKNRSSEVSLSHSYPMMNLKLQYSLNAKRMKLIPKLKTVMRYLKHLLYDNNVMRRHSRAPRKSHVALENNPDHSVMEIKLQFPSDPKRMKLYKPTLNRAMENIRDSLNPHGVIESFSPDGLKLAVPLNYKPHSWFLLEDKMNRLNENPIYRRFNISQRRKKPHVNLLIIVSSAPRRSDRRFAIRSTWWKLCKSIPRVSSNNDNG